MFPSRCINLGTHNIDLGLVDIEKRIPIVINRNVIRIRIDASRGIPSKIGVNQTEKIIAITPSHSLSGGICRQTLDSRHNNLTFTSVFSVSPEYEDTL